MAQARRKREVGRGERVLPGVWRLRLPLPWPGVPHCNAWALAAGDGVVLVDTGMDQPGSLDQLERALDQVDLSLEDVSLVVCTHAHADHYGMAEPIVHRSGAPLWMHPAHGHMTDSAADPEAMLRRRLEVARQSGVPEGPLREWAERRRAMGTGVAGVVEPDRDLVDGVEVATDLGAWRTYETPGHAPSHVCLHQPQQGLLISGDHLLGRVAPFYDYGHTPDPAGEFLASLDVIDELDARLCLPGHGRPFGSVHEHIEANRVEVRRRIEATAAAIAGEPRTVLEIVPEVFGEQLSALNAPRLLQEALAYLVSLERAGRARRVAGEPEHWVTDTAAVAT